MIKAIVFDIGGVLLMNKSESVYRKLSEKLEIDYAQFNKLQHKNKEALLSGKMSSSQFANIIRKKYNTKQDILKKWKEAYLEIMLPNNEILAIAKNLRKRYKLAIISNAPEIHTQINKERGIFSYFNSVIISCEAGLVKPNKEIFELALHMLDVKAKECVFIDDREEHLDIPKKMGFSVIHFRDNLKLVKSLDKLGVIVQS